ncbi:nodulation protein NfeD [Streptomyces sp. TRM64462]|uniref:NfeD family protein n=1 Tax=Streptomyces sp. TRM64462 TaxID=2741726 RepID=UPI0020C79323|nr:nodulation protein NfeD [Streptomyces sp. TRM64462]
MAWRVQVLVLMLARLMLGAFACLAALPLALSAAAPAEATAAQPQQRPTVLVAQLDGTVTPVFAEHLEDGVHQAARDGHTAFIVETDTPGGLLQSTRDIVQTFLSADVPVVVHVTPSGARAASAGAYITMAAHIAAMAPGTHIGAGTPVTGQGEPASDKVVNDAAAFARSIAEQRDRNTDFADDMVRKGTSLPDQQALRMNVVDLIAPSRAALLDALDGRQVTVGPPDATRDVVLNTADAEVVMHELGFLGEIRQLLASPELAFLFLSIGTLAVIYELAAPGVGLAGVTGVILLVLGFVALSVLPFGVAGLLLLLLAALLFVAEVLTPGVGIFAAGGTASLVFAGIFLFRGELALDPIVVWPTALVVGAGVLIAGRLAWRARRAPAVTSQEALIGRTAAVRDVAPDGDTGQVFVDGAWWTVRLREGRVREGEEVRVVDRDGLNLVVEPTEPEPTASEHEAEPEEPEEPEPGRERPAEEEDQP